jgi:LmbE family N-acetylglucosaminyl deacetylase
MNALVVVAHPDDELLGCGGTCRRLADEGARVSSCVLSAAADARFDRPALDRLHEVADASSRTIGITDTLRYDFPNIQLNVVPHLDVVRAVEEAILRFRPDWIFTHHPGDLNIDHRVCYEATMAAIMLPQRLSRNLSPTMIRRVYLMEIPSSSDWAFAPEGGFRANSFFDIGSTLERKMTALREFDGALKPHPHPRSEENIRAHAQVRGAQVGLTAAEAFCLVRDLNV